MGQQVNDDSTQLDVDAELAVHNDGDKETDDDCKLLQTSGEVVDRTERTRRQNKLAIRHS